jgi:hypothetical protein
MRKLIALFSFCICLSFVSQAEARSHRAKVSRIKQTKQNRVADKYHLSRIKDLAQLKKFIKNKWLVLVSNTDAYQLDEGIGKWDPKHKSLYHYARSYVKDFLDIELTKCYKKTGDVYKIYSLVRTLAYQKLLRENEGDGAIMGKKKWQQSAHLTGATVDIYSKGLSPEGRSCLRTHLLAQEKDGKIIAMRESGHWHVFIVPPK